MKHLHKSFFSLALASFLSLASCTSDEMLSGNNNSDSSTPIQLTLTVNRGDAATRTTLTENPANGGLTSEWEEGDVIYVYSSSGNKIGTLTIESGWESPVGVFSGTVEGVKDGDFVSLFYYNLVENMVSEEENENAKFLKIDLSKQNFSSVGDLAKLDILTSADPNDEDLSDEATVQLSVKADNTATVKKDVTLKSKLAFARFSLNNLPSGAEGTLFITDINDNLYVKHGLAFKSGYRVNDDKSPDGIKITNVKADNDVYVALVPNAKADIKEYTLKFRFVNDKDGKEYTFQFENPTTIEAGKYYNSFDNASFEISGVPVAFPVADDDLVGPVFEVNGKKFRFTRANLQYNTVSKKYLIPEKQTEYLCKGGKRIGTKDSPNTPDIIGLFRWGCTGIDDNVLKPWAPDFWHKEAFFEEVKTISGFLPSQNSSVNATIATNSTYLPNGTIQDTSYDWGKAYSIQEGGHYFTLTDQEFIDVIDNNFAACCTVDNIEGVVILPYKTVGEVETAVTKVGGKYKLLNKLVKKKMTGQTAGTTFASDKSKFAYDRLTLTHDQLTALNGVFLPGSGMNNPSTGKRPNMVSSDYSGNCYYWTATPITDASRVFFVNGGSTQNNRDFKFDSQGRSTGCSVRLVKEVPADYDGPNVVE